MINNFAKFLIVFFCFFILNGCQYNYHSDGTYLYVHKGDTLYSLSRKNNLSMRDVIIENGLSPPYTLEVGQRLRIPRPKTHLVQKGDTLYNISKRYGMSVSSLSKLNRIKPPYTLDIGQELLIASQSKPVNSNRQAKSSYSQPKIKNTPQAKPVAQQRKTAYIPSSQRSKKFIYPVKGKLISGFGINKKGQQNDGINISAPRGASVLASEAGTIGYAGNELKGYGNLILIRHNNGWMTAYAHNQNILVKKGQKVRKGQKIATVGSTGSVSSPQLHFEIRYKTKVVNPKLYLR